MKSRARLLLLTAILVAGCLKADDGAGDDELGSLRGAVQGAFAPGSTLVWDLVPREYPNKVESVTWSLRDGSSLLVPFYRLAREQADSRVALMAHVTRDGRVTPLFAADDADAAPFTLTANVPPPTVLPCGDEAIVRICGPEDSTLWVTDIEQGRAQRSEISFAGCKAAVLGRALDGERFFLLQQRPQIVAMTEWSCQGGELQQTWVSDEPLPAMLTLPIWVEEIEPRVLAWVRHLPVAGGEVGSGQWVYERSDGAPPVSIGVRDLPAPSGYDPTKHWERVRREASGSLLVDGIGGLYRWHVEDDGRVEMLGEAPSPEASGWQHVGFGTAFSSQSGPNPQLETLEVPLSYAVQLPTSDGFTSSQVPSTPCQTREACRRLGESYLRGIVHTDGGPLGLYLHWTWQLGPVPVGMSGGGGADLTALVIAPLDRALP